MLLVVVVFAIGASFSRREVVDNTKGIPPATAPQTVELKNGDTYQIEVSYVSKVIAGNKLKMIAYNGSVPGPTIKVHEGDQVTIHFVNKSDIPTLLHSHGVRMDNPYDGSQLVQKDVNPGESFDYVLKFTDPGVMWYHPHVREDFQQPMGLYGNFVVIPKDENYWPKADHEETIAVGDILLENGDFAPFAKDYFTHVLMGRFGNTMVANGETDLKIKGEPGEVHRFYLTNVATTRTFNLGIAGAKMKLIGSDNGRVEKEMMVDSVILAPSERAVVDVFFPQKGEFALEHRTPAKTYRLGAVTINGDPFTSDAMKTYGELRKVDGTLASEFALARTYLAKPSDKNLKFTVKTDMNKIMSLMMGGDGGMGMGGMDHGSMMGHGHGMATQTIEWEDGMPGMNLYATDKNTTWVLQDEETGKENMDVLWKFPKGSFTKITLKNNDPTSPHPMHHPFHAHGNRFVVLSVNGVPNDNMAWKDTVLVKNGDTVDILLENANPGKWMAHCHIAEHMHSGMMIEYDVE